MAGSVYVGVTGLAEMAYGTGDIREGDQEIKLAKEGITESEQQVEKSKWKDAGDDIIAVRGDLVVVSLAALTMPVGVLSAGVAVGIGKGIVKDKLDDGKLNSEGVYYSHNLAHGVEIVGLTYAGYEFAKMGSASIGKFIENRLDDTFDDMLNLRIIDDGFGGLSDDILEGSTSLKTQLDYITSSGLRLEATQGKTTTVLGRFEDDTKAIVEELGNIKSTNFGPRDGGFNLLNVPDDLYVTSDQFWDEFNEPWLRNAVDRGDIIKMATEPTPDKLSYFDTKTGKDALTGFGREYNYLIENGYKYDSVTKSMIKE